MLVKSLFVPLFPLSPFSWFLSPCLLPVLLTLWVRVAHMALLIFPYLVPGSISRYPLLCCLKRSVSTVLTLHSFILCRHVNPALLVWILFQKKSSTLKRFSLEMKKKTKKTINSQFWQVNQPVYDVFGHGSSQHALLMILLTVSVSPPSIPPSPTVSSSTAHQPASVALGERA